MTAGSLTPTAPVRTGGRWPALDGLRALAVGLVVATHIGFQTGSTFRTPLGGVLARGDAGVAVFFLLSGFLLYRPWAREHLGGRPGPALGTYLRHRALRVLPAYWLLVLVVLATVGRGDASPSEAGWQLLLLQVYAPGHLLVALSHTWSLAVEVTFYLALPLVAALSGARPRDVRSQLRVEAAVCGAMVATGVVWTVLLRGADVVDGRVGGLWLPQYLDWFGIGMGVAVLSAWHDLGGRLRVLDQLGDAAGTCWAVAALLFWLTTTPLGGPRGLDPPGAWEALLKHVLYGLAALALMVPAVFGTDDRSPVRVVLSSRPARHLGRISYGVFLWHLLVLEAFYRVAGIRRFEGHTLLVTLVVVPLSLLAAELSLRLVEDPAMRAR